MCIRDRANAIYDGTSAIMLSGETAAGRYPVEAVRTMDAIARKTESHTDDARLLGLRCRNRMNITAATAHAACTTAKDIGADAILTVSQAGITAQMVSSFRPETTVVALLLEEQVQRQMALYWGVEPITMPRAETVSYTHLFMAAPFFRMHIGLLYDFIIPNFLDRFITK